MMELGATVCTARAAHCGALSAQRPRAPRHPGPHRAEAAPNAVRFEDTDRYARGPCAALRAPRGADGLRSGAARAGAGGTSR